MSAAVADGPTAKIGRYRVLRKLAEGGMAEILLARAEGVGQFEKHIVLKRILPRYAEDPRFVRMFLDEARLAARLHHHNVAQVYDIGEEGGYYLTMEYLHGEDVRAIARAARARGERVPLPHALHIVASAAAGLHYAHELRDDSGEPLGIVHRDVSPSNIVATFSGAVKVVDFGVAWAAKRCTETVSGVVKGKVAYMSPEQCRGDRLDRRSDIFSLGIVLYELTVGERPFDTPHGNDYSAMARIMEGTHPRPGARVPDYPPLLEAIVERALQHDPADRYQRAEELVGDLEEFAAASGHALSSRALAGYLVDCFGERPEPWRTGGSPVAEPEVVERGARADSDADVDPFAMPDRRTVEVERAPSSPGSGEPDLPATPPGSAPPSAVEHSEGAPEQRADSRRRRTILLLSLLVVLCGVAAAVYVGVLGTGSGGEAGHTGQTAPPTVEDRAVAPAADTHAETQTDPAADEAAADEGAAAGDAGPAVVGEPATAGRPARKRPGRRHRATRTPKDEASSPQSWTTESPFPPSEK